VRVGSDEDQILKREWCGRICGYLNIIETLCIDLKKGKITMGEISIFEMNHPRHVSYFIKQVMAAIDDEVIDVYFKEKQVLPAACVPICGIIHALRKNGKVINVHHAPSSFLKNIHFDNPYKVAEHLDSLAFPFAKIWRFDSFNEVTKLVNGYLDEISSAVVCSKGLIECLEWSLNETMDNVLQHSDGGEGYMMGVVHKKSNYVLFSIFDDGQGIYNSMKDSEYHPRTAIDAISIAIQEGKTRDKRIGQGNGLWGLNNIILSNKGKLEITSHGSSLMLRNDGAVSKFTELPFLDRRKATTTVNISFNYANEISVAEALGGYIPCDVAYEDKLDDENVLSFVVREEATGFGTRIAGERIRNKVLNYLKRIDTPTKVNIDFSGISMISSSFADEFIGKLIVELGFFRFTKLITMTNVNSTVEPILNRSVSQRMAQQYS